MVQYCDSHCTVCTSSNVRRPHTHMRTRVSSNRFKLLCGGCPSSGVAVSKFSNQPQSGGNLAVNQSRSGTSDHIFIIMSITQPTARSATPLATMGRSLSKEHTIDKDPPPSNHTMRGLTPDIFRTETYTTQALVTLFQRVPSTEDNNCVRD